MEKTSYSTKRKKRRTRKCLNEIRNRLRRKLGSNSLKHSSLYNKSRQYTMLEPQEVNNRLVTVDRITLKAMFPNAIRSETITRPALEEIKQKQKVNIVDVIKGRTVDNSSLTLDQELLSHNRSTSCDVNYIGEENESKTHINETKCSDSSLLFSPTSSINKPITINEINTVSPSTTSSEASQDYRHQRYEDLVNEIPSYLQLLASVNREDAIKKTITSLQKLYMESFHKEYERNATRSSNGHIFANDTTENESIVENPSDYIRLEHDRQQNRSPSLHMALSESSSMEHEADPACMFHPDLEISPYKTPDYNYYPHQLK